MASTPVITESHAYCSVKFFRVSATKGTWYVPESTAFGALLRSYRTRLGAPQSNAGWLAEKLAYSTSTVYGWECGDPSKGLPSRATILSIGQWYGLSVDEVNHLILICGMQRKRPVQAAHYVALSPDEARNWRPLQGSMFPLIDVLRDQLSMSREAYIAGELRAARRLAASVLARIEASEAGQWPDGNLSCTERDERGRLWVQAWHRFFEASALLEPAESINQSCQSYLSRSRAIRETALDARLTALLFHLEGDYYHLRELHAQAMPFHYKALERLGGSHADAALAGMIQRLIILDGAYALPREQLDREIHVGRRLAESLPDDSYCARVLLREAIGRVQGMSGDPTCWHTLGEAESEARQRFPVGYVTALYSRMVALSIPSRQVDRDKLRAIGSYAHTVAMQHGWQRRIEQITQTAALYGVDLPNSPTWQ